MSGHVIDDLGAYILGTLTGDEERSIRVHLESCPACRHELTRIQGAAELLDSAKLAEEPPPELEERILRAAGAAPPPRRHRRRFLALAWTLLLAAAAFAAGMAMGRLRPATTSPDQVVALQGEGTARGDARLFVLPTGSRRIELTTRGLPTLPPGEAWAVWFQNKQGERRSAGTFLATPDGAARVTLTVGASSAEYTVMAVTRTDQPDAPWTLVGNLQP